MEFLTSTILSGIAWDGLKRFASIPGSYIKNKLTQWVVDDNICDKIAEKINNIPKEYKKSKRFLEVAIEEDEELISILNLIKPNSNYIQNNNGSNNSGSNFINGSKISLGDSHYYIGVNPNHNNSNLEKLDKKELKKDYEILANRINDFMNCTSVAKLSGLWRRASADSSQESSTDFLIDTAKLVDKIEYSYNNITTSILDIDVEMINKINTCRDEAIRILNYINDLKMATWQLTVQYNQELELFVKGKTQQGPSKEWIFRDIAYDVNAIKDELNKYSFSYWNLNELLKKFLNSCREKIMR